MSTLEELLGIDPESAEALRAETLATNDHALLRDLILIRRSRGLTQADIAKTLGISQPSVAEFEAHDSNPTLATIRRYAHAVRALIKHHVEADEGQLLDERRDYWASTSIQKKPTNIEKKPLPKVRRATKGVQGRFSGDFQPWPGASGQHDFVLAS